MYRIKDPVAFAEDLITQALDTDNLTFRERQNSMQELVDYLLTTRTEPGDVQIPPSMFDMWLLQLGFPPFDRMKVYVDAPA